MQARSDVKSIYLSFYTVRSLIGLLGFVFPLILIAVNKGLVYSISITYYTDSSVFYISIISIFSVLLILYQGYDKSEGEIVSDKLLTTIAGISGLIVVYSPMICSERLDYCAQFIDDGNLPLYGHTNRILGILHNIFTGVFFLSMAVISSHKFTRTNKKIISAGKRLRNKVYQWSAGVMWFFGLLMPIARIIEIKYDPEFMPYSYTFILETIIIWAFSLSWVVKGMTYKLIFQRQSLPSPKYSKLPKGEFRVISDKDEHELEI